MRKEIPILFSTEMVKAILEGRKTMTRRIIKPQPDDDGLWNDTKFPRSLQSTLKGWNGSTYSTAPRTIITDWYKAHDYTIPDNVSFKWKPSIHMPKGAARIWLENINLKVERLLDITEED